MPCETLADLYKFGFEQVSMYLPRVHTLLCLPNVNKYKHKIFTAVSVCSICVCLFSAPHFHKRLSHLDITTYISILSSMCLYGQKQKNGEFEARANFLEKSWFLWTKMSGLKLSISLKVGCKVGIWVFERMKMRPPKRRFQISQRAFQCYSFKTINDWK